MSVSTIRSVRINSLNASAYRSSLRAHSNLNTTKNGLRNVQRRSSNLILVSNRFVNPRNCSRIGLGNGCSTIHPAVGQLNIRSYSWWPWSSSSNKTPPSEAETKVGDATKSASESVISPQVSSDSQTLQQNLPPSDVVSKAVPTSEISTPPAPALTPETSPTPVLPVDAPSSSVPEIIPPVDIPPLAPGTLSSLGLTSYWPPGLFTSLFEFTNIYIAPLLTPFFPNTFWIPTFLFFNVISRLFILPFAIGGARASAKLSVIAPSLTSITAQAKEAQMRGDVMAVQMLRLKQRDLMQKSGVKIRNVVLPGLIQAMVQFSAFLAIRRICVLPLPQLKMGGVDFGSVAWIKDLTIPDPYYILPILNTALMNVQLTLSARDMATNPNPNSPHFLNLFRVLSIVGTFFFITFPAGLNLHLIFSITLFILQTVFLRNPSIRTLLKLPKLPEFPKGWKMPSILDSFRYAKDNYQNQLIKQQRAYETKRKEMMRMSGRSGN